MPWLKIVHIIALVSWCASLLYLPALIAASSGHGEHAHALPRGESPMRSLFTLGATPLALLAIASGTALFLRDGTFGFWLILKLTLVAGMVLLHVGCGLLIMRVEREPQRPRARLCALAGAAAAALIAGVLYLVLSQPA